MPVQSTSSRPAPPVPHRPGTGESQASALPLEDCAELGARPSPQAGLAQQMKALRGASLRSATQGSTPSRVVGRGLTPTELERAHRAHHPVTSGLGIEEASRLLLDPSSQAAQAPVADAAGNAYLATEISADYPEGYLRKLDPQGKELWSLTVPGGLTTRPHLGADGTIWVGSGKGDLLNVAPDGTHLESVPVGRTSWNNFSFGADGEIYLNTASRILAFQPDPSRVDLGGSPQVSAAPERQSPRPTIVDQGESIVIGGGAAARPGLKGPPS